MATLCDTLARDFGELEQAADSVTVCQMQELTSTAVSTSGDCCTK
jgi:hypothetical protein